MSGGSSAPAPTEEERALQTEQAELLKLQRTNIEESQRFQELLQPLLFEELGIIPTYEDFAEETTKTRNPEYDRIQQHCFSAEGTWRFFKRGDEG